MGSTRRELLAKSGSVVCGAYFGNSPRGIEQAIGSNPSSSTPQPPDQESFDAVLSEAYGELVLSPDRPYWAWEINATSDLMRIEFEVVPKEGSESPDVLVMTERGFSKYETKIENNSLVDGPLLSDATIDLGPFGEKALPLQPEPDNFHWRNFDEWLDSQQPWSEDSPMVRMNSLECLTHSSGGKIQESHAVEPDNYYVVFDWTDAVLSAANNSRSAADVSVRAINPKQEKIEVESSKEIKGLYSELPENQPQLIEVGRNVATAICGNVPQEFHSEPGEGLQETVPKASRVIAATNIVLAAMEDQLGYEASFAYRLSNRTSWSQWGLAMLPIVSSLQRLTQDACSVTEAERGNVVDEIEDMVLSLGILVADILAVQFGVVGRVASAVTRIAHKYLLGRVARTLGLNAYVVLLREIYMLTQSGIAEALQAIKQTTRGIAEEYDILGDEEVTRINSLQESDLEMSFPNTDYLSLGPQCQP